MLKVIFVDDEVAVLEQLKRIVRWDKLDIQIVGVFLMPQDAITFLQTEQVDIIISDISMPVINGMEFARRIRDIDKHVKIILLSAYETFSNAQAAMRLSLCDYLLKPITPADIEASILRVCNEIQVRTQQEAYITKLEKKALMSDIYLRDRFLQSMVLNGNTDSEEFRKKMAQYQINTHSEIFQVMLLKTDSESRDSSNIPIYEATIRETIRHVLDDLRYILFADLKGQLCIIIERPSFEYLLQYDAELIAIRIRDIMKIELNFDVWVGYAEIYKGTGNLLKGYLEALYALEYCVYTGSSDINQYCRLVHKEPSLPIDQHKLRSTLIYLLRCGNLLEIKKLLRETKQQVESGTFTLHYTRLLYIDIIITLNIILQETGLSAAEVFGESIDPVILVYQMSDLDVCDRSVNQYCEIIVNRMNSCDKQSQTQAFIRNVTQRIDDELSNSNLSVHSLACDYYISDDHLNVLFKSVMKKSIKRYIIERKMERAHDLLSRENYSVSHVAKKTGFLDVFYFSKSFKKCFGIAPSEIIRSRKIDSSFPREEN